ncbi:IS66-like element accessory protein TnpA [Azospirillum agricola]|uniref:IS66-like element accessory protein TnpA n=1 Tax=Azospirillum agricola TaxID=1720247 RepID=UPI000A0EFD01|nr:transposase [Azospirillum agricola]SMH43695.1 transposase [Azospirillum lipoferum]
MQRVEIITGKERRRRWSEAEKARLVAETLEPGAIVAHVARRHGVAESCLYTWRRHLVGGMADRLPPDDAPLLIPVSIDKASACEAGPSSPPSAPVPRALVRFADGTRLEIGADYPTPALTALIAALTGRR